MKTNEGFLKVLLLICILLFFRLTRLYLGVIVFALITGYFSVGIYEKTLKKWKKRWLALLTTWTIILLTFILPLLTITTITVKQASQFVTDITQKVDEEAEKENGWLSNKNLENLLLKAEQIAEDYGEDIDTDSIYKKGISFLQNIATKITKWGYSLATGVIEGLAILILYIILTTAVLIHKNQLILYIKEILPLDKTQTEVYLRKIGSMLNSIVKGTFIIAVIQGILAGITFAIAGVPYVGFWILMASFFYMIPVIGGGILSTPIGIILIASGSIWQGIFVLGINLLIVGNIDNILRPKLVSKDAKINGALLVLSIISGLSLFGFMGIIYGPIVMMFIITTIEYYLEQKKKKYFE